MYVVTLARKPLSEATVAANVLKHATGALAIDASRVALGRWPPNLVLCRREVDCPVAALDEQSGILSSGVRVNKVGEGGQFDTPLYENGPGPTGRTSETRFGASKGGASRFFRQIKGQ